MSTLPTPDRQESQDSTPVVQQLIDHWRAQYDPREMDESVVVTYVRSRPLVSLYSTQGALHFLWGHASYPSYVKVENGTTSLEESRVYGSHSDKIILDEFLPSLTGVIICPIGLVWNHPDSLYKQAQWSGELQDLLTRLKSLAPTLPRELITKLSRHGNNYQVSYKSGQIMALYPEGSTNLFEFVRLGPGALDLARLVPYVNKALSVESLVDDLLVASKLIDNRASGVIIRQGGVVMRPVYQAVGQQFELSNYSTTTVMVLVREVVTPVFDWMGKKVAVDSYDSEQSAWDEVGREVKSRSMSQNPTILLVHRYAPDRLFFDTYKK